MPNIELALVICEEGIERQKIVGSALKCRLNPICCSKVEDARSLLPQAEYKMIFCNESLSDGDYRAVIRELRESNTHIPVIVFGRSYDWDSYLKALAAGAYDYIVCPPNPAEVQRIIWLALAERVDGEHESGAAA